MVWVCLVRLVIAQGSIPIAALLIGVLAQFIGIVPVYLGAAILEILILTFLWFFTNLPSVEKQLGIDKNSNDIEIKHPEKTVKTV